MKRAPYELALESTVAIAHPTYCFRTADGVCSKQSFRTAELLLLEELWERSLGRLLCLEANYGVVGTILVDRADAVTMTESSARATKLCSQNARRNDVDATVTTCADLTSLDGRYDTIAYAPKPYTSLVIGKQRLADALSVLRSGGHLFLAAAQQTGLSRYAVCLEDLEAQPTRIAERDGYQVLRATRPATFDPPTYVTPAVLTPTIGDVDLELVSVPGLFAASELDKGTRLLFEEADIADGDRVLDLCCGYGAIGAYAGQIADCELWLSDDNQIATRCAECTLEANDVAGDVVTADCVEGVAGQTFDRVLCNPPTHAGDGVLSELFAGLESVLAAEGRATIVHHQALDFSKYLREFDRTQVVQRGSEHVVLDVHP